MHARGEGEVVDRVRWVLAHRGLNSPPCAKTAEEAAANHVLSSFPPPPSTFEHLIMDQLVRYQMATFIQVACDKLENEKLRNLPILEDWLILPP